MTSASDTSTGTAIWLRSAAFGYAGHPVIEDLTLRIEPGEVVALLGANGSGKSTLIRGLLGLNDHLGGQVEINGQPLTRRTDRTRLGYVPQRHTLSGSIRSTVREVVATGRLPHRPWWRPASRRDHFLVNDALETVGLSDRGRVDVATLSGGQQRRVLIARALAGEPSVLIMDEPTAGVDAASQEVLANVLQRLVQTGVTMLVATHELDALAGVIDRIVEMDAGHRSFDGTPQDYALHVADRVVVAAHEHGHRPGHGHHHDALQQRPRLLRGPSDPTGRRRADG